MSVDNYRVFTMFDWAENYRPEVRIDGNTAILYTGSHYLTEISGSNKAELKNQLEGYAEIFAEAARSLNA